MNYAPLKVSTAYSGSFVVVFAHPEHYLDARKNHNNFQTDIELVRNGRVYFRISVLNEEAAEYITHLMKKKLT